MFTLTFEDLRNPAFHGALRTLGSIRALPGQVGYDIAKILKAIRAEEKIVQGLFAQAVDPFLEKDAAGNNIVVDPMRPGEFKVKPNVTAELQAALKELLANTVEIKRPKLKLELVAKDLSPEEILLLDPIWQPVLEKV